MAVHPFASKTRSDSDLAHPAVARVASELRRFALRLGIAGDAFAVNGVLRRRLWVRRHKLWEYARGVACVLAHAPCAEGSRPVLDFGGGATLPVFDLARRGHEVLSLDIDGRLTEHTNRMAGGRGWKLRGSTFDLTQAEPPSELGVFDAVISFSVLEHIPKEQQPVVLARLARLVKPGGVFALTFDYGREAPVENAIRDPSEIERLVAATGMAFLDGGSFADTRERFVLDQRHPDRRFTFASLFLQKRG